MESRWTRAGSCALLIAILLLPIGTRAAEEPEVAERPLAQRIADSTFDVLVLRPTGFAAVAVGVGLCIPAVSASVLGGREPVQRAIETFVRKPGRYVFTRPLGDL